MSLLPFTQKANEALVTARERLSPSCQAVFGP